MSSRGLIGGDPGANGVLAGSILAGSGTAACVDGGYQISGRWPFASGCRHADWLIAGCTLVDDPNSRLKAFIVAPAQCEILDTWHTAGLRGTGSHDFVIDDVFVPDGRAFDYPGISAFNDGPLYRTPVANVWGPNIAAVALGIARDAIDSFVEIASTKRQRVNRAPLAERETVQEKVGLAEALLRSGRALLFETVRDNWATLSAGGALSDEQTALGRLASATAARNSVEAVDLMFHAAGTTSVYTRNRLERCFRDVHMVPQHVIASPLGFITAGRSVSASASRDPESRDTVVKTVGGVLGRGVGARARRLASLAGAWGRTTGWEHGADRALQCRAGDCGGRLGVAGAGWRAERSGHAC